MRKFFFLCLLLPVALQAQRYYCRPDFAVYADTSLAKFISKLQYTLVTKNKNELRKVLAPDLKYSFGGESGLSDFEKMWALDSDTSHIWETLSSIICRGGSYSDFDTTAVSKNCVVFPTTFNALPAAPYDQLSYVTLWADNVNVREKPATDGKILLTTSHEILEYLDDPKPTPGWVKVRSFDKKTTGYVKEELTYSPYGYRMWIKKQNDNWKIVCFIAGD